MAENTDRFTESKAGTTAATSATKAASTGHRHIVTAIKGFVDVDAIVTVESPAGTVLAEWKFDISNEGGAAATTFPKFAYTGLAKVGATGEAVVGKVSASTGDCHVSIDGFTEEVY